MNSVFVNPVIIHVLLMLFRNFLRIRFFHIYQIAYLEMSLHNHLLMFAHIISLREKTVPLLREVHTKTFVVHLRLGIVMPVLAKYLAKVKLQKQLAIKVQLHLLQCLPYKIRK